MRWREMERDAIDGEMERDERWREMDRDERDGER